MKIKSNIFVFLIIICILFSISTVSAGEIQADTINMDNDYQSNIELNEDANSELISEICNDEADQDTELEASNLGSGEDPSSFTQFERDVNDSGGTFNLDHDYAFNESEDENFGDYQIDTLVINGNNHVLDGSNSDYCFKFTIKTDEESDDEDEVPSCNLVINDLTFTNFKDYPFWFDGGNLTLNNVNFTNCSSEESAIIFTIGEVNLTMNNCNFYSNTAFNILDSAQSRLILNNSNFSGNDCKNFAIGLNRGQLIVENCIFENFTADIGSIINYKGDYFALKDSKFLNSKATLTGGAIIAKYFPLWEIIDEETYIVYPSDAMVIENCVFSNLSSSNNGGAIHIDLDSGSERVPQTLIVNNSNFTDCNSKYGGAISILGGNLNISQSNFINNNANFEGGAIYSSWTNLTVADSNFTNNTGNQTGGALFFDKGKLTINGSNFLANKALKESDTSANAIYAHDVMAYFTDSVFDNGGVAVYADFASDSILENIEKNDDIFLMDNHNYIVSVESKGIKINLTGDEVIIDTLPSRFDAREWGWTTPGKLQGDNDDCWAFATIASIETALLKSTGVAYNLSQNYVQKLQLKYFEAGDLRNSLTGFIYSGLGYALSWYGVLEMDNEYDARGMIADTDLDVPRIHVQDAMIIPTGQDDTVDLIKRAIMKYGAVTVQLYASDSPIGIVTEGDDIAVMDHGTHFVSLIGWDDNYTDDDDDSFSDDENPYPNFAWITKDSLSGFSVSSYTNFPDFDYYPIVPQRAAIAYIFENDIDYHVNYQTDLTGLTGFDENYTYYSNEFTSKYDEYIGAVGTYFNESGINYSFDIFVNNEKVHSQSGVSEFAGFRTIVLDEYIPIKTGDQFKVVFKSNALPYQAWSRVHYKTGMSLVSNDGNSWTDFAPLNKTVCLKAYTLEDDDSFLALSNAINQTEEELNLTHDYTFNEMIDSSALLDELNFTCIYIDKNKLIINGNNHVIDGAGLGAEFNFEDENGEIVINDLTFKNFNVRAIFSTGKLTLNNVNFTDFLNSSENIMSMRNGNLTLNNCNFYSNQAAQNVLGIYSDITVINSSFTGNDDAMGGIEVNRGELIIHNSTFENFTAKNGAMISYKGHRFELVNSSFINSYSLLSGGAILAKYFPLDIGNYTNPCYIETGPIIIKDCEFTNLSCESDGGAIHIDLDSASHRIKKTMNIVKSNFTDCRSKFGGAISILGGNLNISESNFINNCAGFEGGAIYSSWTNLNISQTNIRNNNGTRNAGAIYFDKGKLTIQESNITGNKVLEESDDSANAIYAHDVEADFSDSTFDNGGVAVYADFASDSKIENVEKNDDIFLMDNHNYILSVESKGIKLNFTNNEIIVDTLPSRFNASDWGWTTPGKKQGDNDDCWAFATIASIETALLKSTGVAYNLSQNYVQKLQLKYYEIGDLRNSLTGFSYSGLGYALSWYGVMPTDADYDDRGMILDVDMDVPRIHVQDAMFIYTGLDDTVDQLKRAIMKYGAVSVQYWLFDSGEEIETEGDDIALMNHDTHFISLIGWDDDLIKYDGNPKGIWITKDSLLGFSTAPMSNFPEIDYYAIAPQRAGIAYIFENNIDYHVNYQTDLTGLAGFDENYTYYSNEFTSKYDELIGAVGTYFNESGISYSFDILVNNETVHSQNGVSEFAGFRTIVLEKYIPIKTGDQFKVVFKSNAVPYQAWSRVHYLNGTSLASNDGRSWTDFAPLNKTVCLKAYTLEIDDESSFTALFKAIEQSEGEFNLTHDYRFNESIDPYFLLNDMGQMQVIINKTQFVINGNNHVIDGANGAASFYTKNPEGEIIFNDLTFKNFNGTALLCDGTVKLNNVNFTDFKDPEKNIISVFNGKLIADNCNFHSNIAKCMISGDYSNITVNNSNFTGNKDGIAIKVDRWHLIINNSSFENFTSKNGAVINFKGDRFELVNSRFINAHSNLSGGAILAKYFPLDIGDYSNHNYIQTDPIIIKDCEFTNLSCGNDGGAIHIDLDSASHHVPKTMNIIGSNFTDCRSVYGGAISILGGNLNISTSNFINNYASFEGGAIYSSWTNLSIANSNFKNNTGGQNAGALYFDKGKLTIKGSDFIGNKAIKESNRSANTIYAHDVEADFRDSSFDKGGISVYADFASDSKIENVEKNDDIFLMDNHDYIVSVESEGIKLNFTHNEIIVDTLPSRFDARDWGWTTPGKVQGDNDDCWAFATIASIETALGKSTGVLFNLSQNYVQTLQLKYSEVGDLRNSLTGFSYSGLGYALSWYGVLPTDSDYDDRGMIRDTDMEVPRIHVQDAMFIYTGLDDTIDQLKRAIMKYGAVTVQYWVFEPEVEIPTEGDDIAIMAHETHFISLVGWDDNSCEYDGGPKGVWITKDSLSGFSKIRYFNFDDIDYYAIAPQRVAIAYIFENDIDYHVNYQTDLTGLAGFDENYTFYSNEFTSKYAELIGAVGTYFNESGINYSFDVFVNNEKVHTQSGVSEFAGFKTIVLNKYIPIKKGDQFKVVFKSNAVPYQAWSRVHYMNGTSLASADGNSWTDFAPLNKTVCLKVYTVADDTKIINNKDISVDYSGESYFTVKVVTNDGRAVGAGESVKFTMNGKSTTVKTDTNGIAKIKITDLPGKYTVTTTYRGKTYKNTVTVKQVLTATKASVKNTDKKLVLKASLKVNGKAVKGKAIKFTFLGKTYSAKTNAKGIAQVTIKQAVIKKLAKKSYPVKVTYLKDTVKTTVNVKQVLKASKVTVKKSAKKFNLKANLKINGKAAKKKLIKFTLLGKTYKAKTNAKGIATVTLKQAVIKKLKEGKTYAVKVAYGKDYLKTSIKVKK